MPTLYAVIVAAALLTACGATASGPPDIVVDRTVCSHCGMLVSEPIYAAAYQAGGADARVFDDIGCLLDAIRREPTAPPSVWVQDAGGGGWLAADAAVFVASPGIRTPMNGGVLAYATAAAAHAAAPQGAALVPSWPALVARTGDVR